MAIRTREDKLFAAYAKLLTLPPGLITPFSSLERRTIYTL